jgi:DNA-binding FrmR family transcriptional regulator
MLHGKQKQQVLSRLRRIEGQVGGLHRMVGADTYCVDVLQQLAAVQGALGEASRLMLHNHIDTCVRVAFEKGDEEEHDRMIRELMAIYSRYARLGPASR